MALSGGVIIQTYRERKQRELRKRHMIDAQWIEFFAIATLLYVLVILVR